MEDDDLGISEEKNPTVDAADRTSGVAAVRMLTQFEAHILSAGDIIIRRSVQLSIWLVVSYFPRRMAQSGQAL